MNNNKVIYDEQTIMDISDSTTSPNNLLQGEIGYSGNGDRVVGQLATIHADSVYPTETSPATHAYSEGDHLIVDGITYIAIDDIAIGDFLTIGANIQSETLGTRMNHIEDGIDSKVSKAGDTMTGDLTIDGTTSRLFLGNNTSNNIRGIIRMHNTNGKFVQLYPNNTTADRNVELPDKNGTIALTNDFDGKVVSFYTGSSAIEIGATEVGITGVKTVTLKKGKYLCFGAINASWTNDSYQFTINVHIGSALAGAASYAKSQSNGACFFSVIMEVANDGDYQVYIGCQSHAQKTAYIPAYQNPNLNMIKVG